MRKRRVNLKDPHSVFLIYAIEEKDYQREAYDVDEKIQILAVVQEIECRQKGDVHPEHLVDFKSPLLHMDGIDPGKQN